MNRHEPTSIERPMSAGRRLDRRPGKRGRRRSRPTWLLLLSFAFMQLVLPAYACALAIPVAMAMAMEKTTAQAVAGESCNQHQAHDSLLCFKHCHPEDGSFGAHAPVVPPLGAAPATPFPEFPPATVYVRFRTISPGIPPPIAISFCRLQR